MFIKLQEQSEWEFFLKHRRKTQHPVVMAAKKKRSLQVVRAELRASYLEVPPLPNPTMIAWMHCPFNWWRWWETGKCLDPLTGEIRLRTQVDDSLFFPGELWVEQTKG